MPVDHHPLFDNAPCNSGQSGPVWFLGGAFSGIATTRECSIPTGLSILLPVLNAECSSVEDPPFHGDTEAEQLACARSFMDTGSDMSATIDGRDVRNITDYRVSSPQFTFTAPPNGLFGINGATGTSVSDGVWLFLNPLPAGHHTIHFKGTFPGFPIDVTYNLTIVPGGRGRGHDLTESDGADVSQGVTKTTWGSLKLIYR